MAIDYHYRTSVGTFWIRPQPGHSGRVELGVDQQLLGSYHSAAAAADDMRGHHTGWSDWDALTNAPAPCDLSEWSIGLATH
jgi:hypothetical protein